MRRAASPRALALVLLISVGCRGSRRPDVALAPAPRPSPAPDTVTAAVVDSLARVLVGMDTAAGVATDSATPVRTSVVSDPPPVGTVPDGDAGPTWDLDVSPYASRDRVTHYVDQFTGPARERFEDQLARGTRYEPMLRARLHHAGLPEDLVYLALIESGYDPDAYSRAAAVGLWQFMASTARGSGLRVDWWIDERRDPVRSTDAAVKFLRYLRDQFGSLYLAAAAYNGGPGRVSRGLTRYASDLEGTTGEDRYFALADKDYLRRETREYVPQLIAAALVAKEPERYGLDIDSQPPFAYDTVLVPAATPLSAVAGATGAPVLRILELNPQILRGTTPPKGTTVVRVPPGTAEWFDSTFASLPDSSRRAFTRVTSRKDESLRRIAVRHHLTEKQLAWYNPGLRRYSSGNLHSGQTVLVPRPAVVAAARDVPDPAIERYGSSRRIHIVRGGETLGGIALKEHTTVKTIMRLNGLRKTTIFPGQALVVRGAQGSVPRRRRKK